MNNHHIQRSLIGLALAAALGGSAITAEAQATYHVSLDTSSFAAYNGPLSLDFQFVDGGDPSNNTVTVSGFDFGTGGSAPADDSGTNTTGNASGGLASGTVTLVDDVDFFSGNPVNELSETFTPGSTLNFDVSLTTNLDTDTDPSFSPDSFVFAILDGNGNFVPTEDPTGTDSLVAIDVDSATPTATAFATLPDANGVVVTPAVAAAPEPSQTAALGLGVLSLVGLLLKAKKRHAL